MKQQHPSLDLPFLLCKAFQKLAPWPFCDRKILQEPTVELRKDFAKRSESPPMAACRLWATSPEPPQEKRRNPNEHQDAELPCILPHPGGEGGRNGCEEGLHQEPQGLARQSCQGATCTLLFSLLR